MEGVPEDSKGCHMKDENEYAMQQAWKWAGGTEEHMWEPSGRGAN